VRHLGAGQFLIIAAAALLGCQQPASAAPPAGAGGAAEDAPACGPVAAPPAGPATPPLSPLEITLGAPGEPAPVGEIPFSHKAHAGDCKIPCLACHVFADQSPVAGIPSGRKCMGCHKFVAKEKPGVRLLAARVKAEQPLRWERVFVVPDFIYFSHRAHLRAKEKLECKDCHGDIAAQKVVRQEQPFTMGRCLACHEQKKAPRDCTVCHK
jgi:Cytochrome c7 and related cytochrome c